MLQFILALSLLLRLILINQSLWLDEAIQALALMGRKGDLLTYALGDYQPPLYHLLGSLWTKLAGFSELSLRSISLFAGVMTVYYLYKIGSDHFSSKVATFVGILAATNPLLIYYSQEGRTYALTTFLVTASFYYFLKVISSDKDRGSTIYYLIFTTLYLWSSYLSWFLWFAILLYLLILKKFRLALLHIVPALTLIAWLPSLVASLQIGNSTRGNAPEWGRVVGGLSWKSLPLTWVKFNLGRISFDNKLFYAGVVVALSTLHLYTFTSLRKVLQGKYIHIILLWLVAPIILGITLSIILPIYQYFRVLFTLPAYILLLSLALSRHKYSKLLFICLLFFQLLSLAYFWFNPRLHRENWKALNSDLPKGSIVAMPSRAQSDPLLYYGFDGTLIEPSHEQLQGSPIYYIRYVEDLFDTSRKGSNNFALSGYTITKERYYSGIQVDIYENSN